MCLPLLFHKLAFSIQFLFLAEKSGDSDSEKENDGNEAEDGNDSDSDFVVDDDEDIEGLDEDRLPQDPILRPRAILKEGFSKEPQGWKLRVPPTVFQFFRTDGYVVTAEHFPGHDYLCLNWRQEPPSWELFHAYSVHFPPGHDWNNPEVKAQV